MFAVIATAAFFALVSSRNPALAAADLELASGGRANYDIVISGKASPSEKHGAEELASFLSQIFGASFRIVVDPAHLPDRAILVGRSSHTDRIAGAALTRGLGDDGFVVKAVGQHIILAGGRQRGSMYACYSLLEDDLGCRWYSSKVSRIPKRPNLTLPQNLDRRELPAFENRDPFYTDAFDADWAARNRSTANSSGLDEARGGKISYFPFVHSFNGLVPPDKYFETHPEYFSMVGGKRTRDYSQLCLTNPDVLRIATEQVLAWMDEHPEAKIYSVSQNDWQNPCSCEKCQAIVDREGAQSGPLLEFVNAIARETAKKHPDKLIDTLAYQYTKDPPKTVIPEKNVRVRLCPIEACVAHPFQHCEQNKLFVDLLGRWSRLTDNLYIWHYVTNFANYIQPVPNFREIEADIRMYRDARVKGLFMQGNYQEGGNGEMAELRAWVMAKLLWNPDRDADALVNDFMQGYFGDAAPMMREYFDLAHAQVAAPDAHAHIYDAPTAGYLNEDFLAKAEGILAEARKAVRGEPGYSRRVEKERLPVRYVRLCHDRAKWEAEGKKADAKQALADEFRSFSLDAVDLGVVMISEGQRLDAWQARWSQELGL